MNKIDYQPSIFFYGLEIEGEPVNFYNYYNKDSEELLLKGPSTSFSISFIAPDFIEGDNFEYSYQIDGGEWSPFSTMNMVSFKSLSYGSHVLKVKYKKDIFDSDFTSRELKINILPPWYLSVWSCSIYVILLLIGGIYLFKFIKRHFHREKLIKELMVHEAYNASLNNAGVHFHELMASYSTILKHVVNCINLQTCLTIIIKKWTVFMNRLCRVHLNLTKVIINLLIWVNIFLKI